MKKIYPFLNEIDENWLFKRNIKKEIIDIILFFIVNNQKKVFNILIYNNKIIKKIINQIILYYKIS